MFTLELVKYFESFGFFLFLFLIFFTQYTYRGMDAHAINI